jgi:PIN domain nuclease of toxin-antitoxin system
MPLKYLLDTHVLLWWIEDNPKLGQAPRALIADPGNEVVVSAATIWEAAIKRALGKLRFDTPVLLDTLRRGSMRVLPITAEHALAAGDLPRHHADPFDRMLVAQAVAEGCTLLTSDAWLRSYPVAIIEV